MAFNPQIKETVLHDDKTSERLPCVMCGWRYPFPGAAHIIDKQEWRTGTDGCDRQVDGLPLCPNSHKVFEDHLRPYLCEALEAFGAAGLPKSWKQSNKLGRVPDENDT
ncbi:MAG: HNH endonuclease [Verrucomicrobia bacterium]|nr:HNH endonuclease [Verrucomicrobiota bacterium]